MKLNLLAILFAFGLLGVSWSQKPKVVVMNSSGVEVKDVRLNGVMLVTNLGASQSVQVRIDRVGTQVPFSFQVGSEVVERKINLVADPKIDENPGEITISPDFSVQVQMVGV